MVGHDEKLVGVAFEARITAADPVQVAAEGERIGRVAGGAAPTGLSDVGFECGRVLAQLVL